MNNNDYDFSTRGTRELGYQNEDTLLTNTTVATLMRNVYMWMALALVITAFTSMAIANSQQLITTLFSNSTYMIVLVVVQLVMVVALTAAINRIPFVLAGVFFAIYAILTGVTISSIFLLYTAESIASTFFITAGTFAIMSVYGYFTKKDLTSWGRILMMGLIGIVLASVVNLFMHSTMLTWITTYVGVVVFVGLTAYDTQKIKESIIQHGSHGVNDGTMKLALMGSFILYLDFINLFLKLLRIFGKRD